MPRAAPGATYTRFLCLQPSATPERKLVRRLDEVRGRRVIGFWSSPAEVIRAGDLVFAIEPR